MKRNKIHRRLRHKPWRAALSVATLAAILTLGPVTRILADRDEIILTLIMIDAHTDSPVAATVLLTSESSGSTSLRSGDHTSVEEGEVVTIEVVPSADSEFVRWEAGLVGAPKVVTTAFYTDTTIQAVVRFANLTAPPEDETPSDSIARTAGASIAGRDLSTILQSPSGSTSERGTRTTTTIWVDFNHLGIESGTQTNPFNTASEGVTAVPATGATTLNFKPGVSQELITILAPMTLNAPNGFARIGVPGFAISYSLVTLPTGSGTVSGSGGYAQDTAATVLASPSANWEFSHWDGDLSGFTNPDSLLMDSDKTVIGVFVQDPALLIVTGANVNNGSNDPLPTSAVAGQTIDIEWMVENNGDPANSEDDDWIDNVFLSRDATFDTEDKALSAGATIAEQESYTGSTQITIPDVSPGEYYLIVRTDAADEVTHTASGRASGIFTHAISIVDSELTQ